jgi:site-specific recombinase XerD
MNISVSKAIEGYLLAANARRLSKDTIHDYKNTFCKFMDFLVSDSPIVEITPNDIRAFLAAQSVSKKTLLNYHIGLSALWTWAVREDLVGEHVVRKVRRPRPEKKAIKPYREEDIRALLNALRYSKPYHRPGKRETVHRLANEERNRALILLLVDTGIRSSELCDLKIDHVDLKRRTIRVMGKGDKERILPFSARTGKALWRYLATRENDDLGDPLFDRKDNQPFDRNSLLKAMRVIGKRAGVRGVNIHRFRHTFAINFLRNGGDPWSLQMMLGHATLEMVKNYLALANADLQKNHRIASPVDHWRL